MARARQPVLSGWLWKLKHSPSLVSGSWNRRWFTVEERVLDGERNLALVYYGDAKKASQPLAARFWLWLRDIHFVGKLASGPRVHAYVTGFGDVELSERQRKDIKKHRKSMLEVNALRHVLFLRADSQRELHMWVAGLQLLCAFAPSVPFPVDCGAPPAPPAYMVTLRRLEQQELGFSAGDVDRARRQGQARELVEWSESDGESSPPTPGGVRAEPATGSPSLACRPSSTAHSQLSPGSTSTSHRGSSSHAANPALSSSSTAPSRSVPVPAITSSHGTSQPTAARGSPAIELEELEELDPDEAPGPDGRSTQPSPSLAGSMPSARTDASVYARHGVVQPETEARGAEDELVLDHGDDLADLVPESAFSVPDDERKEAVERTMKRRGVLVVHGVDSSARNRAAMLRTSFEDLPEASLPEWIMPQPAPPTVHADIAAWSDQSEPHRTLKDSESSDSLGISTGVAIPAGGVHSGATPLAAARTPEQQFFSKPGEPAAGPPPRGAGARASGRNLLRAAASGRPSPAGAALPKASRSAAPTGPGHTAAQPSLQRPSSASPSLTARQHK